MSDCRVPMPTYRTRPTIYIIGPVSGIEDDNRAAFQAMREKLESNLPDCAVLIPHDCVPAGTGWKSAMRRSIREMMRADCVAALADWSRSKGASCEHGICQQIGIPVFDGETLSIDEIREAIL